MLKGVALKHLWLEEGMFWPGLEIAPGWLHDDHSKQPVERLYHMHPPHRAHELESRGDVLMHPEEIEEEPISFAEINKRRQEQFSNVFPVLQFPSSSD